MAPHASGRVIRGLLLFIGWVLVAVPVALLVLLNSSRTTTLASHQAIVRPTVDGWVRLDLGPLLPSLRYPTDVLGADIDLGKTPVGTFDELLQRYAFLAASPDASIAKIQSVLTELLLAAALTGALAGLLVPGLWFLLGARRRAELVDRVRRDRRAAALTALSGVLVLTLLAALVVRPWDQYAEGSETIAWQPLGEAVPGVSIPSQAALLEVDAGLLTQGTRRLVESALDSYRTSSKFYGDAAQDAAALAEQLRLPEEGEQVALLVSDRHDNIGMDVVARAVGDVAGATMLMVAGDDTSTGSEWEAFSLESLDVAFDDYDHRYYVAGNHDHGDFVPEQAKQLGFTTMEGEIVEGPDGLRLLGVHDPRSSGLGNWRDEKGLSFGEVAERLADAACAADEDGERITTVLVHDANLGRPTLERGCADLVVGGHLHVVRGPDATVGDNGRVGWKYTNGTTGGAAYAIAIGTKPRRDATMTLITYREGRPIGLQWVALSPLGDWRVDDWAPLTYDESSDDPVDGPPEDEAD